MSNYRGLVLGKFMPFHVGHEYLIRFAKQHCDVLDVIVGTNGDEPICGKLRYDWIRNTFAGDPSINVIWYPNSLPQAPKGEDDDEFWKGWKHGLTIEAHHRPVEYDLVFTSEQYGWKLAKVLGARHMPVSTERNVLPVSGTDIRNDPILNWAYLSKESRPYFLKRVVLGGAESCGKTTLAHDLAQKYHTWWVPEFARDYTEMHGIDLNSLKFEHMEEIANGHQASVNALARQCNRVMFIDTDPFITSLYSEIYFGKVSNRVNQLMEQWHAHLTVVCSPVIDWVDDPLRNLPEGRQEFHDKYIALLEKHNQSYYILDDKTLGRYYDLAFQFEKFGLPHFTKIAAL